MGGGERIGSPITAPPPALDHTIQSPHANHTPPNSPDPSLSPYSNESVWAEEVVDHSADANALSSPEEIQVMEEADSIPASPATDQTPPQSPPPLPSITLPACRFCGNEEVADSLCVHWPPRCSALLCYAAGCPGEEMCYCPGSGKTPLPQTPPHEEGMVAPGDYPVPGRAIRALQSSFVKHEIRTALVTNATPLTARKMHPRSTVVLCTVGVTSMHTLGCMY